MSSSAKSLLVFLLIPFLIAVGHDLYINYFSNDEQIAQVKALQVNPNDFLVSDLGWVWNHYSPESMEYARTEITPDTWVTRIDPVLQQPTMLVGMVPLGVGCIYLVIAFVLGIWPFSRFGQLRRQKDDDFAVYKHAKSKNVKFSRK